MSFMEDSPSHSDPLGAPEESPDDLGDIERVEHAPEKESPAEDTSEGRLYLWLSLLVCIIGTAVIVVVIVVAGGDDGSSDSAPISDWVPPTVTYAPVPMVDDQQAQLDMIRAAVQAEPVTSDLIDVLPTTVSGLTVDDAETDPIIRAASWVVLQDEYNAEDQIVERFALAVLYYTTAGEQWMFQEDWMSSTSFCGWSGIVCCKEFFQGAHIRCDGKHPEHMAELRLRQNLLKGPIPKVMALLKDLNSIDFSDNQLTGILDGAIFAAMPELSALYVQFNKLTGPIDSRLNANGVLDTLYIQGNLLDGDWPFCAACQECEPPIASFGLDCNRNSCEANCCLNADDYQTCHDLSHTYNGQ